jgi:hypothetical protein
MALRPSSGGTRLWLAAGPDLEGVRVVLADLRLRGVRRAVVHLRLPAEDLPRCAGPVAAADADVALLDARAREAVADAVGGLEDIFAVHRLVARPVPHQRGHRRQVEATAGGVFVLQVVAGPHLGFGRIATLDIEAPNMLANLL